MTINSYYKFINSSEGDGHHPDYQLFSAEPITCKETFLPSASPIFSLVTSKKAHVYIWYISMQNRIAFITTAFSLSYHLLSLNFKFAARQAGKCFIHKGGIAFIFFCMLTGYVDTNQLIWGYLERQKKQKPELRQSRIATWATLGLTSIILFPVFFALNSVYRLPTKKTLFRSIVDCLLLTVFGQQFERDLRKNRSILLTGTAKQKRGLLQWVNSR